MQIKFVISIFFINVISILYNQTSHAHVPTPHRRAIIQRTNGNHTALVADVLLGNADAIRTVPRHGLIRQPEFAEARYNIAHFHWGRFTVNANRARGTPRPANTL